MSYYLSLTRSFPAFNKKLIKLYSIGEDKMALSEKAEKFLSDNADLINSQDLKKLYVNMIGELNPRDINSLTSLLTLLVAPEEFVLTVEETDPGRPTLEGVVYNLTPTKAKGAPLTQALFRAKAHLVLYEIDKGKVASSQKYTLNTREEFNELMAPKGKYNLAIMDSPKFVKLVQEAFSGARAYMVTLAFTLKAFERGDRLVVLFSKKIPVGPDKDPKTVIAQAIRDYEELNPNIKEKGIELLEKKNIK